MQKILAFDFGMKYIGIATGQTITKSATPLTTLRATDGIPDWQEIADLIDKWQPDLLLVGIPLNMDDSPQHLTHCANKFANRLKNKFKLPLQLVDERLSTWESKQVLKIKKPLATKEKDLVNAEAAAILLQQWLNNIS